MNPLRRSTVHDLAALRLHQDSTRVFNSDINLSSRQAKYAVRDPRGNWVAQDAGGLGTVKQRRSAQQSDEGNSDTEPERNEELLEDLDAPPRKDKGKGRARESGDEEAEIVLNPRAQKRRRFNEDLSFLSPANPSTPAISLNSIPSAGEGISGTLPVPSSDMLKCLHYFASTYYTSVGQLYDATREYRVQRKRRRAEKLQSTQIAGLNRAESEANSPHDMQDKSGDDMVKSSDEETSEEEPISEGGSAEKSHKQRGRRKKRSKELNPWEKDMYKLFDGSALMALGMLLQEHVAELLEPNISAGWEKEMALVARDSKKDEKRARKAKEMRGRRHAMKVEESTPAPGQAFESGEEVEGAQDHIGEDSDGEGQQGYSQGVELRQDDVHSNGSSDSEW